MAPKLLNKNSADIHLEPAGIYVINTQANINNLFQHHRSKVKAVLIHKARGPRVESGIFDACEENGDVFCEAVYQEPFLVESLQQLRALRTVHGRKFHPVFPESVPFEDVENFENFCDEKKLSYTTINRDSREAAEKEKEAAEKEAKAAMEEVAAVRRAKRNAKRKRQKENRKAKKHV